MILVRSENFAGGCILYNRVVDQVGSHYIQEGFDSLEEKHNRRDGKTRRDSHPTANPGAIDSCRKRTISFL